MHKCTREGDSGSRGRGGVEENPSSKTPAATKLDKGKGIAGENSEEPLFCTMSTLKFESDYVSEEVMGIHSTVQG